MTVETTAQNDVIILNAPIKRGETQIDAITLLTPTAGTLRGIGLAALASADVEALIKLLPRITYPALTEADVMGLELPDLLEFAGKVIGFIAGLGTLTLPPSLTVDDLMADIAVVFHWPPSTLSP